MVSLPCYLDTFVERLKRKTFLQIITKGWERSVEIVVEDRQLRVALYMNNQQFEWHDWQQVQQADLILSGTEQDLIALFGGEELAYLHAKKRIKTKGSIRDQLKLEALIRLSSARVP